MANQTLLNNLNHQNAFSDKERFDSYESVRPYGSSVPIFNKTKDEEEVNEEEVVIDGDYEREKGLGWFVAGLISKFNNY